MELTVQINTPNVPLFDPAAAAKVVAEEIDAAMQSSVLHLKGQILPLVPVNSGLLRRGVSTSITGESVGIVGRVFDPVAYALPVELGSRPHFPPIAPLALWVRRKLGISDEGEARSVAFLIARKISRRGTPAREFFKEGLELGRGRVESFFAKATARIVDRLQGGSGGA